MSGMIGNNHRMASGRRIKADIFRYVVASTTAASLLLLFILLGRIMQQGLPWLDWQFLTSFPSRFPEKAGVLAGIAGTLWLMALTSAFSVVLGVGAAIYLEELAAKTRFNNFIEININNLAGIPSIVYGMLGLAIFVRLFAFDRSIVAGAATLSLLILPTIILASREALKAVPDSIRHAGFALGATKWQVVAAHTLPAALSGILTGIILAIARAIGETAPLILVGAVTFIAFTPDSPWDPFTALPIQIFNWAARPQEDFHALSAAGILVLLAVLGVFNSLAIYLRIRNREYKT